MESFIGADEVFSAIQNYESDGISPQKALLKMTFVMEQQARDILTKEGYGVRPEYLSGDHDSDQAEWVSEALHLLDYRLPYPLHECAMIILEADNFREMVESTDDAACLAMSMTKLLSMSLLPAELKNYSLIQSYAEPDKKRQKGRSKGGKSAAKEKKAEADIKAKAVQRAWYELNKPERNKAAILAERFGVTPKTIRQYMKRDTYE